MEKFKYQAKDREGRSQKGVVEATNERQAARTLRGKGFFVISLKRKVESSFFNGGILGGVSTSDKVNFTRQLSTMMNAGLPVTEALRLLESQANSGMRRVVSEVLRDVEGGSSLSDALEKHPAVFNQVYIALVRAGEAAGILDKVLTRLADNLERQREFTGKIKGALIYPAIIVVGMVIVAAVMIIFVIPKMTVMYEEFQAELPLPTKILLGISRFATTYWWMALLLIGGLFFAGRILFKASLIKKFADRLLFRLPIFGKLRQQMMLTEFARILGLLVSTGILIVEALNIVKRSFNSPLYEEAVAKAAKDVERGLPLAVGLQRTEVFPPLLVQMTAVGEETGKMDEVLAKVSSYFEQEADISVKGLTSALEPLIMIVLGLGVGFLIISIIMPIYNLTSQI